jgi:hypothetical protein
MKTAQEMREVSFNNSEKTNWFLKFLINKINEEANDWNYEYYNINMLKKSGDEWVDLWLKIDAQCHVSQFTAKGDIKNAFEYLKANWYTVEFNETCIEQAGEMMVRLIISW